MGACIFLHFSQYFSVDSLCLFVFLVELVGYVEDVGKGNGRERKGDFPDIYVGQQGPLILQSTRHHRSYHDGGGHSRSFMFSSSWNNCLDPGVAAECS